MMNMSAYAHNGMLKQLMKIRVLLNNDKATAGKLWIKSGHQGDCTVKNVDRAICNVSSKGTDTLSLNQAYVIMSAINDTEIQPLHHVKYPLDTQKTLPTIQFHYQSVVDSITGLDQQLDAALVMAVHSANAEEGRQIDPMQKQLKPYLLYTDSTADHKPIKFQDIISEFTKTFKIIKKNAKEA